MKSPIYFKRGYEYQLQEDYPHTLTEGCSVPLFFHSKYIVAVGTKLTIKAGYAWDGPSGPTFDTRNSLRGSLVHDVLYQLIGLDILTNESRKEADKELYAILLEDGMSKLRAYPWYLAVRSFGGIANATQTPTEVAP